MVSSNPFGEFRQACQAALSDVIEALYPSLSAEYLSMEIPANMRFGQLASTVSFDLGRKLKASPQKLAAQICGGIETENYSLIRDVEVAGGGYINFHANFADLSKVTVNSALTLDAAYGYVKTDKPETVIVEHTSANPISPINIGQARNPILGDALARILAARGHTVFRHFYVDDVGRQTAVVAYGYKKLGEPPLKGKPDHYIGLIYTLTSCVIEINRLKHRIEQEKNSTSDTLEQLRRRLDEWTSIAAELEKKHPKLFGQLLKKIAEDDDIEGLVSSLNLNYETGADSAVKKLVRDVCKLSLDGIKETLANIEVVFDSWDWESTFTWNSSVSKILERLKATGYVFEKGPVLEFDAEKVAAEFKLKQAFGLKEDYEIPSLTLLRADSTTLYTTRDIPYSLWKFEKAEKVINVIGMEQRLPQLQLKLALWALGHVNQAKGLIHFGHNLVTLPGYKMSSRRGRYITLDEVVAEAIRRARDEVEHRSPTMSEDQKHKISRIVGIGALKYALIEVDPIKPVVFTWDRVINFERNSAPYIQYSYARACSILRKGTKKLNEADYSLLVEPLEHDLVFALSRFPEVFVDVAENLKPSIVADFANGLADKFNRFYSLFPVIKAQPEPLSKARLAMVKAITVVLRNSLELIGIVAPEKM